METRSWSTNVRGPVLIHAAKSMKGIKLFEDGTVRTKVVDLFEGLFDQPVHNWRDMLEFGELIGYAELIGCKPVEEVTSDPTQPMLGDFSRGRFGHVYTNARLFMKPVPYKGHQGFFWVPETSVPEV